MIPRTLVLAAALLATAGFGVSQERRATTRGVLVERWVELVETHRPGERDAAVVEIASLAPAARASLMSVAEEVVRKQRRASANGSSMTFNAFLHRAAVLHSDAFVFAGDLTYEATARAPNRSRPAAELIDAHDGDVKSTGERNWSLEFGRKLLDQVEPSPRDDAFVGAWYHAMAAFLLSEGWLGELQAHLVRANAVRSDDPRIVFDTGVMYEAFSMSRVQAVVRALELPAGPRANVPAPGVSEERALGYYRRVLELTPGFVEARVRYGRMLLQRGRSGDAVVELARAMTETKDSYLLYHAHLFAARAEQRRGHDAEAVAHCRDAARLFPGAQSAEIALSLAELRMGDVPAAIAPVEEIRQMRTDALRDDPWWSYHTGAGRAAEAVLEAMWKAVK